MQTKVQQSKDGSFDIPDELSEAYLLDCGLSFSDIRLAPIHVLNEYIFLQSLKSQSEKVQNRKSSKT